MPKFDMGAAWEDSMLLLRSHSALTGAIAAVFLFLPTLAVSWFGPVPIEPAAGSSFDQVMATMRANVIQAVPYQLFVAIVSGIGGIGILRLWLSRSGISVGEALVFALTMVPTVIVIQLLSGLIVGVGFVLLIVPGLYLWARLAIVAPVVADQSERNPLAAIRQGWTLTKGNGWRIFLFMFLVTLVILVIAVILAGVTAAVLGTGEGIARMLTGLVEGAVAAISGMVTLAIAAATYRQLAVRAASDIFS